MSRDHNPPEYVIAQNAREVSIDYTTEKLRDGDVPDDGGADWSGA